MKKLIVIFKKHETPYYPTEPEITAFFPTVPFNFSPLNMMSYAHIGQHGPAHVDYFAESKRCTEEEYTPLLNELRQVYDDVELVVKKNLIHKYTHERITAIYKMEK